LAEALDPYVDDSTLSEQLATWRDLRPAEFEEFVCSEIAV